MGYSRLSEVMKRLEEKFKEQKEKKTFYKRLIILFIIIAILLGILLYELFNQPYKIKHPKPYGDWNSTFKK